MNSQRTTLAALPGPGAGCRNAALAAVPAAPQVKRPTMSERGPELLRCLTTNATDRFKSNERN